MDGLARTPATLIESGAQSMGRLRKRRSIATWNNQPSARETARHAGTVTRTVGQAPVIPKRRRNSLTAFTGNW